MANRLKFKLVSTELKVCLLPSPNSTLTLYLIGATTGGYSFHLFEFKYLQEHDSQLFPIQSSTFPKPLNVSAEIGRFQKTLFVCSLVDSPGPVFDPHHIKKPLLSGTHAMLNLHKSQSLYKKLRVLHVPSEGTMQCSRSQKEQRRGLGATARNISGSQMQPGALHTAFK